MQNLLQNFSGFAKQSSRFGENLFSKLWYTQYGHSLVVAQSPLWTALPLLCSFYNLSSMTNRVNWRRVHIGVYKLFIFWPDCIFEFSVYSTTQVMCIKFRTRIINATASRSNLCWRKINLSRPLFGLPLAPREFYVPMFEYFCNDSCALCEMLQTGRPFKVLHIFNNKQIFYWWLKVFKSSSTEPDSLVMIKQNL